MSRAEKTTAPADFRQLTELHDMAAHACDLLKSMANEWRLMILCQLSEGEKPVSELQRVLGLSQSALSQHLAVLRHKGIVTTRKDAQSVIYSLAGNEATRIMETLHDLYCGAASSKE